MRTKILILMALFLLIAAVPAFAQGTGSGVSAAVMPLIPNRIRVGSVLYSAALLQRTMKDPFDLAVDTAKFIRRPFLDGLHRCRIYP